MATHKDLQQAVIACRNASIPLCVEIRRQLQAALEDRDKWKAEALRLENQLKSVDIRK